MITEVTSGPNAAPRLTKPGGELGKDQFLKLLMKQLQYQDPSSPMDISQMSNQLAQFTTVEQLIQLNDNTKAATQASMGVQTGMSAILGSSMIGKHVVTEGNAFTYEKGDAPSVSADVAAPGGRAKLTIVDAGGRTVAEKDLGYLGAGRTSIAVPTDGLADGSYTYRLAVTDKDGKDVGAKTYSLLKVDSIRFEQGGVVLVSGATRTSLWNVTEIRN